MLDVLALEEAHLVPGAEVELLELPVLHEDHVGVAQGEVEVESDEFAKRHGRVGCLAEHALGAVEQRAARALEDRGEHGGLAREVAVDGGAAHPDGCTEVVDRDSGVAALREERRGRGEDRLATIGLRRLRSVAAGRGACGRRIGDCVADDLSRARCGCHLGYAR